MGVLQALRGNGSPTLGHVLTKISQLLSAGSKEATLGVSGSKAYALSASLEPGEVRTGGDDRCSLNCKGNSRVGKTFNGHPISFTYRHGTRGPEATN